MQEEICQKEGVRMHEEALSLSYRAHQNLFPVNIRIQTYISDQKFLRQMLVKSVACKEG